MLYRTLGKSGLRVSQAFLGAMTFGDHGGVGAPLAECRQMLEAYAERGGNVIDTASNYRDGASEEIVGELLIDQRESFVLATKYTISRNRDDPNAAGNHRKNLRASLETSLRRLRTDYIDLFWVHMWDRSTPIEETLRALDDAVRAGKILYVGISDAPSWVVSRADVLAEWHGWSPFIGLQVPYSLVQRDIERELLPMATALGLGVAAWSPLGGGILTGKFTGHKAAESRTRLSLESLPEKDLAIARVTQGIAEELGVSGSQVAIAWTMAHSEIVHPILGARRLDQLHDNLGALDVTLPAEMIGRLEAATNFEVGFPTDFMEQTVEYVFGAAALPK